MHQYSVPLWTTISVLSVVCGFGLARFLPDGPVAQSSAMVSATPVAERQLPVVTAVPSPPTAQTASSAPQLSSANTLLDRVLSGDHNDAAALTELQQAVANDPALRAELMRRYGDTLDETTRSLVRELLKTLPTADVLEFSLQLARGSRVAQRHEGFELLAALPPDRDAYQLARQMLAQKQDPGVLISAMWVLRQPAGPWLEESDAVVSELAEHSDPHVRADSLAMLTRWDSTTRATESSAYQALSDHDGDVRQAAINAITNGRLRSDRLKSALLHIVGNDNEDVTIKRNTLQTLTQFSLANGEHAIYRQARAEVERMENSQAPVAAELMGGPFAVSAPAAAMRQVRAGERPTSANQSVLHYDHGVLVAEIDSVPLGTVLNELSRKAEMQIRLADPAIARWPVSASLRALPLEHGVQQILRGFSYALYRTSHTLTLIVLSTQPKLAQTGVKPTSSLALGGTPDGSTDPTPRLPAAVPGKRVPQSLDELQPIAVEEPSQKREVAEDTPSDLAERAALNDAYHEALLHRALDALKSEHKHLQREAINHLAGLGDPRAVQMLVQAALGDAGLDARLRIQAVGALAQNAENLQFTDSVSVDALKTLSEDTDANVRSIARRALQRSKQHQHGPQ